MPTNRIRALRLSCGLSQRKLAVLATTSQQQIQRIEAGAQGARMDVALKICAALNEPLEKVFPKTKSILKKVPERESKSPITSETFEKTMGQAGIDVNPAMWTLKLRLRGGIERDLPISGLEKKRLWERLQELDRPGFVIFDSTQNRFALNLDHLLFWQLLFDLPSTSIEEEERPEGVSVYLADGGTPLHFNVDGDAEELNLDIDEGNDGDPSTQWQSFLFTLQEFGKDEDFVSFRDSAGEDAFFRAEEVSLIDIPLWAVVPDLEVLDADL